MQKLLPMRLQTIVLVIVILCVPAIAFSQVKIGDSTGAVDPRAVLELKDTARGFLLPRMTQAQMINISTPPDGLLVYNTTNKSTYQYRSGESSWMPVLADSAEWFLDSSSARLYLRRSLANDDTIYYQTATKKFIFADTRMFAGATGVPVNLDEGSADKHVFKVTASKFPRSMPNLKSKNINVVYEVDNDTVGANNPWEASYTGLGVTAAVNPLTTHNIDQLIGINVESSHAGQDSVGGVYGIVNSVSTANNSSYAVLVAGQTNFVTIGKASVNDVYGNFLSVGSLASSTGAITGDVMGEIISLNTSLVNRATGNTYGLRIVTGKTSKRNFAIYTDKGSNRFGDSTMITNGLAGSPSTPREIFDIYSTSSMIIPVGTTIQRPATPVAGMFRYNSDAATIEVSKGAGGWSTFGAVNTLTANIDPVSIAAGATATTIVTISGAATTNTVTISPQSSLTPGIMIAWARVLSATQLEVCFANVTNAPVDPAAANYTIKLVQ